jgi:flagellar basal body-associated protein FliL
MEVNNQDVQVKKQGFNKLLAIIIAAAVLLVGGSVAAFVLFDNSLKTKYFLSEKETMNMYAGQIEERYTPEKEWAEKSLEKPVEDTYKLSAEVNMPLPGSGPITPDQIINNSTVTIKSGLDRKEKIATAELAGSFGNFEIDGVNFYLTSDSMMLGLPFLNEILQLKGDDFGKVMQQVDPTTFTGEEKIDFNMLFEGNVLAEEDLKYLEDEYGKAIYDAIPEEAFESTKETVKIGSDNVDTEKITFHLTEKEVKAILSDTLEKMAKDKRLKEMLHEYAVQQGSGPIMFAEASDLTISKEDFDEAYDKALEDAINGLDDFMIPDGFTSTIWVKKDIIVKRDFSIKMGPTEDELLTLYVKGYTNQDGNKIDFEYDFGFVYDEVDEALTLEGKLSNDDGKIKDSITVSVADMELSYKTDETLKKNKRDFDRTFSFVDPTGYTFELLWTGNAEYDGDKMNSKHELTVAGDDIAQDLVTLFIDKESTFKDSIELPKEDNVKDVGSMSLEEMMTYFENDVTPQFEEWLMGVIGFGF